MNNAAPLSSPDVFHVLRTHYKRWLIPTLLAGAAATAYGLVYPGTWESTQALIVRADSSNSQDGPGKFAHADDMKVLQETILELSKSPAVLHEALTEVGPDADADRATWPDAADIDGARASVRLLPPKGAEFGRTEIFYLKVRDRDRTRALALTGAICRQIERRLQELRNCRAESMIAELVKSVNMSKADLEEATLKVATIEKKVGSNLPELRLLSETGSAESALRHTLTEISSELRQAQNAVHSDEELQKLLQSGGSVSGQLMAMPGRLLESQPALRQLKEALIGAEIQRAQIQGKMGTGHPVVEAAKQSEDRIGQNLHDELALATRGVEVDLRVNRDHQTMLQKQLDEVKAQLVELAEVRAAYANLTDEVKSRETLLHRAEQNLADARAAQATALAGSLLSKVDGPDTGATPAGPTPVMIAAGGLAGGLLLGLGLVVLTVPSGPPPAREVVLLDETIVARITGQSSLGQSNVGLREGLQKIADAR